MLALKTLWRMLRLIMVGGTMLSLKLLALLMLLLLVLFLLCMILTDQSICAFGRFRGTGTTPSQLLMRILMSLVRRLLMLMLLVVILLRRRRVVRGVVHLTLVLLPGTTIPKQLLLLSLLLTLHVDRTFLERRQTSNTTVPQRLVISKHDLLLRIMLLLSQDQLIKRLVGMVARRGALAPGRTLRFRQTAPQPSLVQSLARAGGHVSAHVRSKAASAAALGCTEAPVARSRAAVAGQGAGTLHTRGAVYTGATLHLAAAVVAVAGDSA